MGPYRPEFQEIEAYSRLMRVHIRPWEAMAIRALAEAFMKQWARDEQIRRETPTSLQGQTSPGQLRALLKGSGASRPRK